MSRNLFEYGKLGNRPYRDTLVSSQEYIEPKL